ncbi:MAG: ParB N-terminal domain-containing protein [Pseudomonadota bacterium]
MSARKTKKRAPANQQRTYPTKLIEIDQITVPDDRARAVDPAWVEGLAGVIDAEGLISPIAVLEEGKGYRLIAGAHRLEACRSLGWEQITATVYEEGFEDADLIETLENLVRRELSALDRAKHFARFKVAYEAKHGPILVGRPKSDPDPNDNSAKFALFSFHEAIADHTGLSKRSIFDGLKVWSDLDTSQYERLSKLPLADNFSQLRALSEQNHERQDEVLGVLETRQDVNSVQDALDVLDGIERQAPAEKRFGAAVGAYGRLSEGERQTFLENHEDDVRSFAIAKGWLKP